MASRDVIALDSESDDDCVMLDDDEVAAASAAAATAEDEEFARRLQAECWNEPAESVRAPTRQYDAPSHRRGQPVAGRVSRTPTLRDEIDNAFEESLRQDQEKERAAKVNNYRNLFLKLLRFLKIFLSHGPSHRRFLHTDFAICVSPQAREASERKAARAAHAAAAAALLAQQQAEQAAEAAAAAAAARRLRWQSTPEPAADAAGALSLQVRYPDGSRISRRFPSSETVAGLFDAITSLGPAPAGFSVATGFPRRVLSAADLEATLTAAGVGDRDILLVTTN